ncbi:Uu.00g096850.m01.CDS01 [Anthostomella pinea]|uniref:Uu.00g096850.m01.CDS01 n=1 Tax=Anthostomella pinea TaxID=933095 RepID=A0AAI8YEW4_9PEZI|nr:Uu.00g096850.m01.CDS01 [Anthostomella pinea]
MDKREAITASNLGPVVSLLTWIMGASILLAVGIKFTLSTVMPGKRYMEDAALFLATGFSIGFTIAMSFAVANGVGRHQSTLATHQLESLQKAVYPADVLLVLVSTCVQGSVLIFFHELTPDRLHQRLI